MKNRIRIYSFVACLAVFSFAMAQDSSSDFFQLYTQTPIVFGPEDGVNPDIYKPGNSTGPYSFYMMKNGSQYPFLFNNKEEYKMKDDEVSYPSSAYLNYMMYNPIYSSGGYVPADRYNPYGASSVESALIDAVYGWFFKNILK